MELLKLGNHLSSQSHLMGLPVKLLGIGFDLKHFQTVTLYALTAHVVSPHCQMYSPVMCAVHCQPGNLSHRLIIKLNLYKLLIQLTLRSQPALL